MTVKDLIELLKNTPKDFEVRISTEGAGSVDHEKEISYLVEINFSRKIVWLKALDYWVEE